MAEEKEPITIKKYANRRLYNTGTSTYVTLEDLATMLKDELVVPERTEDRIATEQAWHSVRVARS